MVESLNGGACKTREKSLSSPCETIKQTKMTPKTPETSLHDGEMLKRQAALSPL
jgi:hypothetical protein